MIDWKSHPSFDGHKDVLPVGDETLGFAGFVAIHSTVLGPAGGGCRIWNYPSEYDALTDALRLSRGMTYKNAMADLPMGGGKAVLYKMGADRNACFGSTSRSRRYWAALCTGALSLCRASALWATSSASSCRTPAPS
jgi:glutamate dehydrogenase/leucine dehydrogenase